MSSWHQSCITVSLTIRIAWCSSEYILSITKQRKMFRALVIPVCPQSEIWSPPWKIPFESNLKNNSFYEPNCSIKPFLIMKTDLAAVLWVGLLSFLPTSHRNYIQNLVKLFYFVVLISKRAALSEVFSTHLVYKFFSMALRPIIWLLHVTTNHILDAYDISTKMKGCYLQLIIMFLELDLALLTFT